MIRFLLYIGLLTASASSLLGQTNLELKKHLIDGVEAFRKTDLESAANSFAAGEKLEGFEDIAAYNRGRALMDTENHDEALSAFKTAITNSENSKLKSRSWYNSGNLNLMKGEIETAIENYKNSLREDPTFDGARNNLSEAYKLLQQQQQQQEQQEQQQDEQQDDQNQDQDDQEKQDQEEKQDQDDQDGEDDQQDQEKQDQEKQDQEGEQEEQQDQQDQEGEQEQQQEQGEDEDGEPQEVKEKQLSKEEMERILENLENEEEKIQAKLMKKKGSGKKKTIEKQW